MQMKTLICHRDTEARREKMGFKKPAELKTSYFSLLTSHFVGWLPDMDLNHDKQIQSLLCYRYTIGQSGAFNRLKGLLRQSSREAEGVTKSEGVCARPHPSPLPQERENRSSIVGDMDATGFCERLRAN